MKFSVLFAVGANCVRPRAFTERPYEDNFLSVDKPCFMAGAPFGCFFVLQNTGESNGRGNAAHFLGELPYARRSGHFCPKGKIGNPALKVFNA